jgi:hypothetical protein
MTRGVWSNVRARTGLPSDTKELAEQRERRAPKPAEAFQAFSQSVFAGGALPAKIKQ